MNTPLAVVLFSLSLSGSLPGLAGAQARPPATAAPAIGAVKYGANAAAGRTFVHDGVKLYYEVGIGSRTR